jgi:uncharacterized repeat protein (TIGR01451 family)
MNEERLRQIKREVNGKKTNGNVQSGLMNIYSNKDGSLPDISHLDVKRKSRWRLFLLGFALIILILSGIAWLGFLIFNPDKGFTNQSMKVSISGEQNIASGDEVTYTVEYKNIDKVTLYGLEIIFRYPDGFQFISAEPSASNEFNSSWMLGDLAKNSSGKIVIKGKLIGEVGSIKTINATASFQPENFSSTFKETSSFSSQITSSILEINLDGPKQMLPEKKTSYKITYKNNSDQDLENIKVLVNYPPNFVFQEASPAASRNEDDARNLNNQWLIESLGKNEEGEIEISGGFLANPDLDLSVLAVQIGFLDSETQDFSLQQEKKLEVEVTNSNLSLNLIVNGSSQDQPINFGQTLTYSIVYKNLGQKNLDDVSFSIILDSDILDWDSLEDKNAGIRDGNKIIWNKDQVSEFDLIRPLDEGSIDFSIKVKESSEIDLESNGMKITSKAFAALTKIGDMEVEDFAVESNEIKGNINTDIELKVEGRYFDDDNIAVGTGPLPPVVGQKTTFRIYWSLANSLHEVSDVFVSTVLPEGIEWEDKFLAKTGSISYSASDNKVIWEIDRIAAEKNFDETSLWFDVSVTPTKQQAKKLLILTDQTELSAIDDVTESGITKSGKAVTSNLEDDPVGGGRGLVIDITE